MSRPAAFALLAILLFFAWGYGNTLLDPLMRRAAIPVAGWPADVPPIRVALISDLHIQAPDMPPERVARLVDEVNAARPDLILLAGDFKGDRQLATRYYSPEETVAPLTRLKAPLGTFAVLGNHDHWRRAKGFIRAFKAAGIPLLRNQAVRVGPMTLIGIDDDASVHANIPKSMRSAEMHGPPYVAFTHSPDVAPDLPPELGVLLAGHTHCGQVVLPWIGPPVTHSLTGDRRALYNPRYRCGIVRDGARTTIVTGGLGTGTTPFRIGAMPDWWLVTLER